MTAQCPVSVSQCLGVHCSVVTGSVWCPDGSVVSCENTLLLSQGVGQYQVHWPGESQETEEAVAKNTALILSSSRE